MTCQATTFICGGSIYNKNTIITSADCCKDCYSMNDTSILAGVIDRHDIFGQMKRIKSYLFHPDYDYTAPNTRGP